MGKSITTAEASSYLEFCCDPKPIAQVMQTQFGRDPISMDLSSREDQWLLLLQEKLLVGIGANVFTVVGVHRNRSDFDYFCLRCIHTNVQFDVMRERYSRAISEDGPWRVLRNEMEVIAWSAK